MTLCVIKGNGLKSPGKGLALPIKVRHTGLWKTTVTYPQSANSTTQKDLLLGKYDKVFKDEPGEITTFEATLHLKDNAIPKIFKGSLDWNTGLDYRTGLLDLIRGRTYYSI